MKGAVPLISLPALHRKRAANLVKSHDHLSVFAVLYGLMPGEVYADSEVRPASVLIKTCECNLLAGDANNHHFNREAAAALDFWDQVTLDTEAWAGKVPNVHPNRFVREYTRKHFILSRDQWRNETLVIPPGYKLEAVDLSLLREKRYDNHEKVLSWAADWGSDRAIHEKGFGYYMRGGDTLLSWSLTDCCYDNEITVGVFVDEAHRRMGFGAAAVHAVLREALNKGYDAVHWLCVGFNKGSAALARRLGFTLHNEYSTFTSYPPCENLLDLSPADWESWGAYYESVSKREPRLLTEQLLAYVKANRVEKAMDTIISIETGKLGASKQALVKNLPQMIAYYQALDMCQGFSGEKWMDFCALHGLS